MQRLLIIAALLTVPAGAFAENPLSTEPSAHPGARSVRLEYSPAEEGDSCPDAEQLREAVEARLGYPPFQENAEEVLEVRIEPDGDGLVARIARLGSDGEHLGQRVLHSSTRDCRDLVSDMELAISIAIDPLSMLTRSDGEPETPPDKPIAPDGPVDPRREEGNREVEKAGPEESSEEPMALVKPPPPLEDDEQERIRGKTVLSAGLLGAVGAAPSPNIGATFAARLDWPDMSLGLEGRADLPAGRQVPGGRVSSSLLLASVVPCLSFGRLAGCGIGSAGVLRAEGHDLADPRLVTIPYAALGARLAIELPWNLLLPLEMRLDLLGTLTRLRLRDTRSQAVYWSTPPMSASLTLAVRLGGRP